MADTIDTETGLPVMDISQTMNTTIPQYNPAVLSPRQQAIIAATGGPPDTVQILPGGTAVNVNSIVGKALNDYQNAYQQLQQGGDFGLGTALAGKTAAIRDLSNANQTKASIDFATERKVQAADTIDRARLGLPQLGGSAGGSAVFANLATSMQQNERIRQQLAADVSSKLSVGFFDNPLQYIVNQVTLPSEISRLSIAEGNVAQNLKVMQDLQILMSNQHKDNVIAATDTSVSAELNARQRIAAQANIDLATTAGEAAKNELQLMNIRTVASRAQFQSIIEANNVQNANLENEIRFNQIGLEEHRQQVADMQAQQEINLRNMQIGEVQQKIAAENAIQSGIDAGIKVGLLPNGTNARMLDKLPMAQREYVLRVAADPDIAQGRYGHDIASAINIAGSSPFPIPIGSAQLLERLGPKVVDVINANGGDALWKLKTPQEQQILLNSGLRKIINNEIQGIPTEGGIFSAGSALSVAAIPALQNNPVMRQVATMAAGNTLQPLKAQDVMAAATEQVQKGAITTSQASQLVSDIYNSVVLDNNQRFMYNRFNFNGLDNTVGFKTRVQTGSMFGSTEAIDMTNPARVQDILTRLIYKSSAASGIAAVSGVVQ